jgi:hypothetical protein
VNQRESPLVDRERIAEALGLLGDRLAAARKQDVDDIRILIGKLRLSSADEVLAICAEVFPGEQVPARAQLLLEDLFTADDHDSEPGTS